MPNFRSARWMISPILAGLLVAIFASSAAASGYGELTRFNGIGTGATKGHKFLLEEETHAFGVDTKDGSLYVGDERSGTSEEEYRIQKYSSTGAFEGEALLKLGGAHIPAGMERVEDFDGIAVDASKGRIYALVTYERSKADKADPSKEVAGAVYAFSTTPSEGKLVPAEGANATTGLLASSEELEAASESQGHALLEPTGITVDPKSDEVMILGQVDKGEVSGRHVAIERVGEKGKLDSTYVDPTAISGVEKAPDSPVVSKNGKIFFENGNEILELPSEYSTPPAPKTLFRFEEPESLLEGPFKEPILEFDEETGAFGGGLSIVQEGAEGEGRLVADAEVHEVEENGTLRPESPAVLAFHYTEVGAEEVKVSELGWTGGQPGETANGKPCIIGYAGNYFQVAAASGEKVWVLAPAEGEKIDSEVIEFGPGGSGCPTARTAPGGLEATIDGIKTTEVNTATAVVLSAKVIQANVLSVEWKFDDGSATETIATAAGEETQTAEVEHKFAKSGKLTVEAIIHTDDRTTPEVKVSTILNVSSAPGSPKVTTQPSNETAVEGQSATFKSTATGEPKPTVQWEESHDGGTTWADAGAGTSGGTTETLTVTSTTIAENGYKYRAKFTNTKNSETSSAATLTVETIAAHKIKEEEEKRKQEEEQRKKEEEAKRREAEEAAARKGHEEAAKKAQEEAAARAAAEAAAKKAAEEAAAKAAAEAAARKAAEEAASREGTPSASVSGASLSVSSAGAVAIKVSCPVGVKSCTGTVTLRTLGAVVAKLSTAGATQAKAKAAVLTLGSGTFTIGGGQVKTITLHLSAKARQLLAHSHTLKARATIIAHDPSGTSSTVQATVTLHAAKAKHH